MKLTIFDTLKGSKIKFEPIDPKHIKVYVCGPTVYDYPHIGNARPVVVFDVLIRLLRSYYPKVTYVRNITDIDDKINARSQESGEKIENITTKTEKIFKEDMENLNALPPDKEPRATAHIQEMQEMIKTLISKDHAYEKEGHVLFNVPSMPSYGQLSRLDKRQLIAGARIEVAPYKRDPRDYILWKPSPPELPGWESPWGRGRPGWHIECSAMSKKHLGNTFDIHGGGQDLIFPHHENELAQSKCALGPNSFAKYWMHNGYLLSEGEKMSKSLGNFYTVRELLSEFPGEAIRFLLLKTHYRQPIDFTKEGLAIAKTELDRFYHALRNNPKKNNKNPLNQDSLSLSLLDDLNSPKAISILHQNLRDLNKATSLKDKCIFRERLETGGKLLGLFQTVPDNWFKWQPQVENKNLLDAKTIQLLILKREKARKNGNYKSGDQIRDQLMSDGIILEDNPNGTTWRRS